MRKQLSVDRVQEKVDDIDVESAKETLVTFVQEQAENQDVSEDDILHDLWHHVNAPDAHSNIEHCYNMIERVIVADIVADNLNEYLHKPDRNKTQGHVEFRAEMKKVDQRIIRELRKELRGEA